MVYQLLRRISQIIPPSTRTIITKPFRLIINRYKHKNYFKTYQQYIHHSDLVFDVGAHHGVMTEFFLKCGAKVIAIEPEPDALAILHKKFDGNPNVTIIPFGVASKPGELKLHVPINQKTASSFSSQWHQRSHLSKFDIVTKDIEVITLDILIEKYGIPSFTKIDVEGFELEVLNGCNSILPALSLEFTKESLPLIHECLHKLELRGQYYFQYNTNPTYKLSKEKFTSGVELEKALKQHCNKYYGYGDLFATIIQPSTDEQSLI